MPLPMSGYDAVRCLRSYSVHTQGGKLSGIKTKKQENIKEARMACERRDPNNHFPLSMFFVNISFLSVY